MKQNEQSTELFDLAERIQRRIWKTYKVRKFQVSFIAGMLKGTDESDARGIAWARRTLADSSGHSLKTLNRLLTITDKVGQPETMTPVELTDELYHRILDAFQDYCDELPDLKNGEDIKVVELAREAADAAFTKGINIIDQELKGE